MDFCEGSSPGWSDTAFASRKFMSFTPPSSAIVSRSLTSSESSVRFPVPFLGAGGGPNLLVSGLGGVLGVVTGGCAEVLGAG